MRFARVALASLAISIAAACGGDGSGPDPITGTYELQTIQGMELPIVLEQSENYLLEVTSGQIILEGDGSFTDQAEFRETIEGEVFTESYVDEGTYTRSGDRVIFRYPDNTTISGTISGAQLTVVFSGVTLIYSR